MLKSTAVMVMLARANLVLSVHSSARFGSTGDDVVSNAMPGVANDVSF